MKNKNLYLIIAFISLFYFKILGQENKKSKQTKDTITVEHYEYDSTAEDSIPKIINKLIAQTGTKIIIRYGSVNLNIYAAAIMKDNERYIAYNPKKINELKSSTHSMWSIYFVMAHEIAHHIDQHFLDGKGSSPIQELAADETAGFLIYKLGGNLQDAQLAIQYIGDADLFSKTHPTKPERLYEIEKGWNNAKFLTKWIIKYRGRILDNKTSKPITGALVTLVDLLESSTTDNNGIYSFNNEKLEKLMNQKVLLSLYKKGYENVKQKYKLNTNRIFEEISLQHLPLAYYIPYAHFFYKKEPAKYIISGSGIVGGIVWYLFQHGAYNYKNSKTHNGSISDRNYWIEKTNISQRREKGPAILTGASLIYILFDWAIRKPNINTGKNISISLFQNNNSVSICLQKKL
jgi:hypothetical protein